MFYDDEDEQIEENVLLHLKLKARLEELAWQRVLENRAKKAVSSNEAMAEELKRRGIIRRD